VRLSEHSLVSDDAHRRFYGHGYAPVKDRHNVVTCIACVATQQGEERDMAAPGRMFLSEGTLLYDPHVHGGGSTAYHDYNDENEQPERSRMVDGEEYMTVSEYVRRVDPVMYPQSPDLISASGYDRTYVQLGVMAASTGRDMGIEPVKMFHPEYEAVNGWPLRVLAPAWSRFKMNYEIRWLERDPEIPGVPEPVQMPVPEINPRLYAQIRAYAERKGTKYTASRDPRWRGAFQLLLEARENETPQQALIRRTSAAGVMYAIEQEYARQ
jgi:hypothetical protein